MGELLLHASPHALHDLLIDLLLLSGQVHVHSTWELRSAGRRIQAIVVLVQCPVEVLADQRLIGKQHSHDVADVVLSESPQL